MSLHKKNFYMLLKFAHLILYLWTFKKFGDMVMATLVFICDNDEYSSYYVKQVRWSIVWPSKIIVIRLDCALC
jgi:hypothetical protein